MSKLNDITVNSYDKEFQNYVDRTAVTVSGTIKIFLDTFLDLVPKDEEILEIGSGHGRDANYIEAQGYSIKRTDAAQSFVNYMRQNGNDASVLNIVKDRLPGSYQAILANAVFVHFDESDFVDALNNVIGMLENGGLFGLTLHKGDFRGMSDHKHSARYFHDWSEEELRKFLAPFGLKEIYCGEGESISGRKKWIIMILKKS